MDSILFTKIKEKISERKMQLSTLKVEAVAEPDKERLNGNQRLQEACFIVGLLATIFITISLFSFNPADPSWTQTSWAGTVENVGGSFGAWIADTLFFAFGSLAYLLPVILLGCTWIAFRKKEREENEELDLMMIGTRILGLLILFLTSCALADTSFDDLWYFSSGGVVGDVLTSITMPILNLLGSTLIFMFLWGAGLTLFTGISWLTIVDNLGGFALEGIRSIVNKVRKTEDETYQVEHEHAHEEKDDAAEFSKAVDSFETPKISSRELSMFANAPQEMQTSNVDHFERETAYSDDPLFSTTNDSVPELIVEPTETTPVMEMENTGIDDGTYDSVDNSVYSMALQEQVTPESLEDGINLSMRSNATIEELDNEALVQDPLLSQVDAEQSFSTVTSSVAAVSTAAMVADSEASVLESLSSQYNEQYGNEFETPVFDNALEEISDRAVSVDPSIGLQDNLDKKEGIDTTNQSSFSALDQEVEIEDLKQEESFNALEEETLPAFSAVEEVQPETLNELHINAFDSSTEEIETVEIEENEFPHSSARNVAIEETVLEEDPTHSDADIAAFQALVAKEKATQAALQNPFLVNSEPNLPKPTSPM
ncbi:MAG: DNA translocase FtsK, partial [Aliivibrio sp.]|nr:DNA translocase FtsK [Aliivibrio sp.]